MNKAFFLKLSNYKPIGDLSNRVGYECTKETMQKYLDKKNIKAIEKQADAFYKTINVSENVQKINDKLAKSMAIKKY